MSGIHRDLLFCFRSRCFAWKNPRWGLEPTEACNSGPKDAVLLAHNHRWGLEPIETSNSGANRAVSLAQNDSWGLRPLETSYSGCFASKNHRWELGPIETSNSGANHAVLHAQNDRWGLGPIETCNTGPKLTLLHAKTTDEGWNRWRLVILMLITLLCMHKTTGEDWYP